MSFLSNVFKFEKNNASYMLDGIKEDPERIFLGAADPLSSKFWGKVLGKDYEPLVDQWGGASEGSYKDAEEKGIDTKDGGFMHKVARTIASYFALQAAGNAMGGGAGAADAGTGGAEAVGGVPGAGEAGAASTGASGGAASVSGSEAANSTVNGGKAASNATEGGIDLSAGGGAESTGGVHTSVSAPKPKPGFISQAADWYKSLPKAAQYGIVQAGAGAVQAAMAPSPEEEAEAAAKAQRDTIAERVRRANENTKVGGINVGTPSGQPLRDSSGNLVYPVSRTGYVRDGEGNLIPQNIQPRGLIEDAMTPR